MLGREGKRLETKKKIMDSAFRLFAEQGTEFSLQEVAREVGIKKASIYAHFTSKESLLYDVINREIDAYFFEINKQCGDLESLFYVIMNYYDKSGDKLFFWKRLLLFPPEIFEDTLIQKIKDLSRQRFEIVRDIIISDIDSGVISRQDPEVAAISYFSMIHGLLSSVIIYRPENLTGHYESIWHLFWNGIR
jgi:AcrR family transcriptional regulator